MRKWTMAAMLLTMAFGVAAQAQGEPTPKAGYLCCNMRVSGGWISDINYLDEALMLPAGTRLTVLGARKNELVVGIGGAVVSLGNDYSRALDINTFTRRYVRSDDPAQTLAALPPEIAAAIRNEAVVPGMTREQVAMSLGYPIVDENPRPEAPLWKYWVSSDEEFHVLFDDSGHVKGLEGPAALVARVTKGLVGEGAQPETPCALNVYRVSARGGAYAARESTYLFVDGKQNGKLDAAQGYCLQLPPGEHLIEIRAAGIFGPGAVVARLPVTLAEAQQPVFVRYERGFAGIDIFYHSAISRASNELDRATEMQWRVRR